MTLAVAAPTVLPEPGSSPMPTAGALPIRVDVVPWDARGASARPGLAVVLEGYALCASTGRRLFAADLAARLAERPTDEVLAALDGEFNLIVDRRDRRVAEIATDRAGSLPLFVRAEGSRTVVSSRPAALAPGGPRSELALLDFLAFGYLLDGETFTPGERALGPGALVTVGPDEWGGWRSRLWSVRAPADRIRSEAEAAEAFAEALGRAVHARATALPLRAALLSGGLDSRTVLALSRAAGLRLEAFSYGDPRSRDVRYAAEIAAALGVPHRACGITDPLEASAAATAATSGLASVRDLYAFAQLGLLAAVGEPVLDGFVGDVIVGGSYAGHGPAGSLDPCALIPPLLEDRLRAALLGPTLARRVEAHRRERLATLVSGTEGLAPDRRRELFLLEHRARRLLLGHTLLPFRDRLRYVRPFIAAPVLDVFLDVPPALRVASGTYVRMLRAIAPGMAALPWTRTGRPAAEGATHGTLGERLSRAAAAARYYLRRLSLGRLRPASDRSLYGGHGRSMDRPRGREVARTLLLGGGARTAAFLRRGTLRRMLSSAARGAELADVLAALVQLELVLRGAPAPGGT